MAGQKHKIIFGFWLVIMKMNYYTTIQDQTLDLLIFYWNELQIEIVWNSIYLQWDSSLFQYFYENAINGMQEKISLIYKVKST